MQLKIYDEINDYDVDILSLDDYNLETIDAGEELIETIREIIEAYADEEVE